MSKDFVVLNFKQTASKLSADDIANTIPANQLAELLNGDASPYYSVEAIEYPAQGNTHIWGVPGEYTEKYFQSLEKNLKKNVIPGSKNGHSYGGKPANDIFLVGMKLVSNGDGTGTAYFKNYIPPKDFNGGDNYGLIRDAKLGLLQFSLVSKPIYDEKELAKSGKYLIIGSKGGDRNDAVEEGAMKQTVNSADGVDFGLMRDLIKNGQVTLENIDGNVIQNGKVSRPALRQIVSRADCENKAEYSELISMIDKTKNGGKTVELKEAIDMVGVAVKNGQAVFADIAKNAGCDKLIRNETDDKNAELAKALNSLELGDNPVEKVKAILAENKANAEAIVKNRIIAEYGMPEKDGAKNTAYDYALSKCVGKNGKDLDDALNALKDDGVMKAIRGSQADIFMQVIHTENAKPETNKTYNGVPVIEIGGNK
jgi:hypothetical protein